MNVDWKRVVEDSVRNLPPLEADALGWLRLPDAETLQLVDAAWRARRAFFGDTVKVNVLLNAKSGFCPEDCGYCSQSRHAETHIDRYPMLEETEIVERAREAYRAGAQRFCIVAALRGPTWKDIERVARATREIKRELPLEVCACLGLIDEDAKAIALKRAGVDAYNHNLNTSASRYGSISTTHTYADRLRTLRAVKNAGLSPCAGVIAGMGETDRELVELAFALREVGADSIPVNFLIPVPGTALASGETLRNLTPWHCLRILAVFRLVNPRAEIRASAGRELHLRSLQPLAMLVANSIFLGDYLTEKGQAAEADWQMMRDLGLAPVEMPRLARAADVEDSGIAAQGEGHHPGPLSRAY